MAADHTLSQIKDLVRKKLGIGRSAKLSLVQLREGKEVDLEDGMFYFGLVAQYTAEQNMLEDDYEAFLALSKLIPTLHILIRVGESARPSTQVS